MAPHTGKNCALEGAHGADRVCIPFDIPWP